MKIIFLKGLLKGTHKFFGKKTARVFPLAEGKNTIKCHFLLKNNHILAKIFHTKAEGPKI